MILVLEESIIKFEVVVRLPIDEIFDLKTFRAFTFHLDEELIALEQANHSPHESISYKVDRALIQMVLINSAL